MAKALMSDQERKIAELKAEYDRLDGLFWSKGLTRETIGLTAKMNEIAENIKSLGGSVTPVNPDDWNVIRDPPR